MSPSRQKIVPAFFLRNHGGSTRQQRRARRQCRLRCTPRRCWFHEVLKGARLSARRHAGERAKAQEPQRREA